MAEKSIVTKQRFKISIDGLQDENFTSFSDVSYEAGTITDKGGADQLGGRMYQSKGTWKPITLTRTFNPKDSFFQNWQKEGKAKNVSIIYLDAEGNDAKRFNLQNATISSYSVGGGESNTESMQTETVTLGFESGEWQSS
jgi:phage tail-like protein